MEKDIEAREGDHVADKVDSVLSEDERREHLKSLNHAILSLYVPKIEYIQGSMKEITKTQQVLLETVAQENDKYHSANYVQDLSNTFSKCRRCRSKLVNIRKNMHALSDRMNKLKKRAEKLKIMREKQELKKAQEKAERQAYQERLVAKPAKHLKKEP